MKKEFQKLVKPRVVEELVDYYLFRRMAAPLVPGLARLKLTPNQVSFICLLSGLGAAWVYLKGHFFLGSLVLLLTVVLDCCDGMLARYTGLSSPVGRVIDGTFDAVWCTAVWLGIFFSGRLDLWGSHQVARQEVFLLMLAASISMYAHCWTFESVKNSYLLLCNPKFSEGDVDSRQAWQLMKQSWSRGRYFEVPVYLIMAGHYSVFGPNKEATKWLATKWPATKWPATKWPATEWPATEWPATEWPATEWPATEWQPAAALLRTEEQVGEIRRHLDLPVRLWTFAGEGTHNTAIILFGLLTPLEPGAILGAFWIILIPINLVWFAGIFFWFTRRKKMRAFLHSCSPQSA